MPWDFYVVAAVRIKCEDWALKCEDLKLSFRWVDPPDMSPYFSEHGLQIGVNTF